MPARIVQIKTRSETWCLGKPAPGDPSYIVSSIALVGPAEGDEADFIERIDTFDMVIIETDFIERIERADFGKGAPVQLVRMPATEICRVDYAIEDKHELREILASHGILESHAPTSA